MSVDSQLARFAIPNGARNLHFAANKPGLKVVVQEGAPLPPEHLISSVNLQVEVRGTEVGGTFRLLERRKLQDLPLV